MPSPSPDMGSNMQEQSHSIGNKMEKPGQSMVEKMKDDGKKGTEIGGEQISSQMGGKMEK